MFAAFRRCLAPFPVVLRIGCLCAAFGCICLCMLLHVCCFSAFCLADFWCFPASQVCVCVFAVFAAYCGLAAFRLLVLLFAFFVSLLSCCLHVFLLSFCCFLCCFYLWALFYYCSLLFMVSVAFLLSSMLVPPCPPSPSPSCTPAPQPAPNVQPAQPPSTTNPGPAECAKQSNTADP